MKKILIIAVAAIAIGVGAYFLFFNKPDDAEEKFYQFAIEDSFISNVKDSQKLFKTTIVLKIDKDNMDEYFKENIYIIRDTILIILRSLTVEDISGADIMERLRVEISSALNRELGIDNIDSIYFNDFVMQ
ncbi:MAG: flagellar basal body-associated FliL family protein [Clostridiales bacterium]|nr:flagellar basal body-associated FliL family protein [Clostridiales bacterium]